MAFTTELLALVFLQTLHACTFAACHLGAMAFIQRALPATGAAIGQSLYYALGTGATQALVFQFSGLLYSQYGQRAFLGMTVMSAIGMAALIALARRWNGGLLVKRARPSWLGARHSSGAQIHEAQLEWRAPSEEFSATVRAP